MSHENLAPKARTKGLVVQPLNNEVLLYDLGVHRAYCLNETSALVWQLANGKNSLAEISDLLTEKLETPISVEVVWMALEGLQKDDLLEESLQPPGLSRRQAIQLAASAVALPVILAVDAPGPALAASGCGVCPPDRCGTITDACSQVLNCPNCTDGRTCFNTNCVDCLTCGDYPGRCGSLDSACGLPLTCGCTGLQSCLATNCVCPDPDAAATLPSVAPFCAGLCGVQIRLDDDGGGGLMVVASGGCVVNCNDCGGGG